MTRLYYPGRDASSYFLACEGKVVLRGDTMNDLVINIQRSRALLLIHSAFVGTVEAFECEEIRAKREALSVEDLSDFWESYHNIKSE